MSKEAFSEFLYQSYPVKKFEVSQLFPEIQFNSGESDYKEGKVDGPIRFNQAPSFSKHGVVFVLPEEKSGGMLSALIVRTDERIDLLAYAGHLRPNVLSG